jgi:hypothetical protein
MLVLSSCFLATLRFYLRAASAAARSGRDMICMTDSVTEER